MFSVKIRKAIAAFLLAIFINSVITPTISYALTSGPTAPEHTSFEPVDTTEMVNLATGDFVYNLPLLEVPGPAGGYSVSLSYHAGLMPNEEASWVGYGFTVNPGAIARTVNGYPDDHLAASRTREDFNEGGKTNTFSVGIGYPGVSYGLAVSHDTNRGIGIGGNVTLGTQVGPLEVGASFGVGPFGGSRASVGVSLGNLGISIDNRGSISGNIGLTTDLSQNLSANIGLSTNFNGEVGFSANFTSLGSDMSTKGIKAPRSVGGLSISQVNSNANDWNTESFGFSVPIPLGYSGVFLNLGYNYFRYYLHQSSLVNVIGSLHADKTRIANPDNWAFDSYALINTDSEKALKDQEPDKSNGGSFPSYDIYQVNAQGLNGSIQPYILNNGTLFRQNLKEGDKYDIKFEKVNNSFNFFSPVHFRFKNDFSNSFAYSKNEMQVQSDNTSFHNALISPPTDGYNNRNQKLAGSKNIEWYTNLQISNGEARQAGFIDYQSNSLRKLIYNDQNIADQVGGYSITNESGITYHYALPVYEYDEFSKSFVKNKPTKIYQNNFNPTPYAYSWLLTSVTGADYVDRNGNGMVDETDWGYWVSFDYGRWADDYKWRNPVSDYHSDLDDKFQFYSRGKKQIYYLDAIKTKTHVAVFEKAVRKDGKGLVDFDLTPTFAQHFDGNKVHKPTEALRLKNIYLVPRSEYNALGGDDLRTNSTQNNSCASSLNYGSGSTFPCLVFDEGDNCSTLSTKATRVISFEHSNQLQPNTINSFSLISPQTLEGKLTLNAVRFKGKAGSDLIPPLRFDYGSNNPSYNKDAYDMWGFYKSDYKELGFKNLERLVTDESALSVDAWSLKKIMTSLGASIEILYETDKYLQPPLSNTFHFSASSLTRIDDQEIKIGLFKKQQDIQSIIKPSGQINMIGMSSYTYSLTERGIGPNCTGAFIPPSAPQREYNIFNKNLTIERVEDGGDELFIYVKDASLAEDFKKRNTETLPFGRQIIRYECDDGKITDSRNTCVRRVQYDSNGDGKIDGSDLFRDEFYTGREVTCQVEQEIVYSQPEILAGNIGILGVNESAVEYKGGGLRVKELAILLGDNSKRITKYSYNNGITSYEPSGLNQADYLNETNIPEDKKSEYAYLINKRFSNLLQIAREVPSPGVIYKFVTVQEELVHNGVPSTVPGKRVYQFEVFDEKFIERIGMKKIREEIVNTGPEECFDGDGKKIPCKPTQCFDASGDPIPCPPPTQTLTTYSPLIINDYAVWVASLKTISTYGSDDQLLEQTTNNYLHDGKTAEQFQKDLKDKFNNQGVISQVFNENRISEHNFGKQVFRVFSKKTEYPLIGTGVTQKNYKTGISTTSENIAFDYYTGAPTKVITQDSYGNRFMTETTPAYRVSEYSGMTEDQKNNKFSGIGLRVNNPNNKHMISQVGSTYVYQVDQNNLPVGLVSASIQTWSDHINILNSDYQTGIWRKHRAYQWNGKEPLNTDGTYNFAHFSSYPFKWDNPTASTNWKITSEVTLYDTYSHNLEALDINGNKASTHMDPKQERVIASTLNSGYNEMAYSGAEYYSSNSSREGGVDRGDGNPSTTRSHSGKYSLLVGFNSKGFKYSLESGKADLNRKYRASVWVHVPGESEVQAELDKVQLYYTVNGMEKEVHPEFQKSKSKSWYLINTDIIPNGQSVEIGVRNNSNRGVYFDDFRVHPLDAAMTAYVYDQSSGELNFVLDGNNFYIKYEYDGMGRLVRASKEMLNFDFGDGKESFRADRILKETKYNYGQNNK